MDRTDALLDAALIEAWRIAASDLGFRLEAPYCLSTLTGERIWVEGFLPDFGGNRGMIFRGLENSASPTDRYISRIGPMYRQYKRDSFIEALSDWGWFGPAERRPDWLFSNGG